MDLAFRMLRDYARNSNQLLTDVARNFVDSATADFPPAARQPRGARRSQSGSRSARNQAESPYWNSRCEVGGG
jgi:hypothetical protein